MAAIAAWRSIGSIRRGAAALGELELSLHNGEAVMELARVVKGAPEIAAMRCALAACEAAMAEMQAALAPGVTEIELWSHLHAGNIERGGEWIETRLLTSGARTNPWLQECGSRQIQAGDLVAFDTDLIGPYGYCADISRSWLCGDRPASGAQRDLFAVARQHIDENRALLKPGVHLRELTEKSDRLPEAYRAHRYPVVM
ncbi:MAG: M24 family metallopeptidase, partial [Pseudomonadota bacterium]|nr:M24 family metallopeptidase [Pseudomonadota bacterium]